MRRIYLRNKRRYTFIDDEDYESLSKYRWWLSKQGYVMTTLYIPKYKQKHIYLHRMVLPGVPIVDHKDRNPLNNQKDNLRACTVRQNSHNSKPKSNSVHSKHKGVGIQLGRKKKWRMRINVNERVITRYFLTEIEASKAYEEYAKVYFGEFSYAE